MLGTLSACTQGRDLFEANGAAPWHAARVVGSNALRESAARAQLDSGSTLGRLRLGLPCPRLEIGDPRSIQLRLAKTRVTVRRLP